VQEQDKLNCHTLKLSRGTPGNALAVSMPAAAHPRVLDPFHTGIFETDNPVFSTTVPKRCEVFSSLFPAFFANIRRTFFRELRKCSSHFD
jgi:hypothetical protein